MSGRTNDAFYIGWTNDAFYVQVGQMTHFAQVGQTVGRTVGQTEGRTFDGRKKLASSVFYLTWNNLNSRAIKLS